jgi:hypothetical protein
MRREPVLVLILLVVAGAALAVQPQRPVEGEGSNFHLFAGIEHLKLDLDPRGSEEFVTAGLDPTVDTASAVLGVGWVFAAPLRLDLAVGACEAELDRPEVDGYVVRALADLHVALLENRLTAVEATATVGAFGLAYDGLPEAEFIGGYEAGFGLTARVAFLGPLGLEAGYRFMVGRFARTTIELPDEAAISVHPTTRSQVFRLLLHIDL